MRTLRTFKILGLVIVLILFGLSCRPSSSQDELQSSVSYLEETIPPCTPLPGSTQNPCDRRDIPFPVLYRAQIELPIPLPTMTERLLGEGRPWWVPHIIVRGTVMFDTTRCGIYPWRKQSNIVTVDLDAGSLIPLDERFLLSCVVDVRINEYLEGEGPPQLTIELEGRAFRSEDPKTITDEWINNVFGDPDSELASAFEGRELVLFLDVSEYLSVEVWDVQRGLGTWFVQRHGDEIRAVSEHLRWAQTDQHRRKLDMLLSELTTEITEAAENRIAITGGRIGQRPFTAHDCHRCQQTTGLLPGGGRGVRRRRRHRSATTHTRRRRKLRRPIRSRSIHHGHQEPTEPRR